MNCSNCGTEIPFDERFCRNCGKEEVPLAPAIGRNAPTVPYTQPPNTVPFNPYGETADLASPPTVRIPENSGAAQGGSPVLFRITIAAIIVALVSISVLAYFIFTRSKADQRTSTSTDKSQPTASPSATNSSATTTPTVQPTTTATPTSSPTPKPTPSNAPPPGATLGYCNDTNVLVRSAPDLNARPVTKVTRGQNLWVLGVSTNYSTWKGVTSNWTQVQIYNGTLRGWVFSPFISYASEKN